MKKIINVLGCATALAVLAITISGCSSTGYSKGGNAAKGMEKTGSEVEAIVAQTELTLTALSNLVYRPAADLVPQYKSFASATKKLTGLSESVDKQSAKMRELVDAYLAEWDAGVTNISNESLRTASQERRADVTSSFDKVADSLKKSKEAFDPLLSDLTDIQQVLELDLTQGGIASVQNITKSAIAHGQDLRAALTDAAGGITELASKMSAQGPAPQPES